MRRFHARYRLDALTRQLTRADVTSGCASTENTINFLIYVSSHLLCYQKHSWPEFCEDCYIIYLIRLNCRISPVRVRTSFGTPKDSQGSGPEYHHNTAHGSIFQLHLHCAHSHFLMTTSSLPSWVMLCCTVVLVSIVYPLKLRNTYRGYTLLCNRKEL